LEENVKIQIKKKLKQQRYLFGIDWFRIILDEAHYIKNSKSKRAHAIYDLSATYRWAVTGTPV